MRNGWNLTGDAFIRDEKGRFSFVARSDDMIVSSGYNIAGPEVEAALLSHPAVAECGVVGAPDEARGMIVKAYVVPAPGRRRRCRAGSRSAGPLAEGGARPEHLVRLTWYVVDMEEYLASLKTLGQIYREIFGAHYPGHGAAQGRASGREGGARRDRSNRGGAPLNYSAARRRRFAIFEPQDR